MKTKLSFLILSFRLSSLNLSERMPKTFIQMKACGAKQRFYSTTSNEFSSKPLFVIETLNSTEAKLYREVLQNKSGVYCFLNKLNNKRYIGSAKDLHSRYIEHISGKKSNKALQLAFTKYGLENFSFIVYIYYEQYETRAELQVIKL